MFGGGRTGRRVAIAKARSLDCPDLMSIAKLLQFDRAACGSVGAADRVDGLVPRVGLSGARPRRIGGPQRRETLAGARVSGGVVVRADALEHADRVLR